MEEEIKQGPDSGGYRHRFYARALRPALAQAIERQLEDQDVLGQLSLDTELALIREAAGDAVEHYAKLRELPEDPANESLTAARLASGQLMTEALEKVQSAVETCGKVNALKAQLGHAMSGLMQQVITVVCQAASESFGNDYRCRDFERIIRERLVAKGQEGLAQGTLITPDQDVIEMAATVPSSPNDEGTRGAQE